MHIKQHLLKRTQSAVLLFTLILQQFAPLMALASTLSPAPVLAAEDAQVDVVFDDSKHEVSFTVEPADMVDYSFVYKKADDLEEALTGSKEAEDGKVTQTLYLGTCSDNICTPHDLKLGESGKLDLTIEHGDQTQQKTISIFKGDGVSFVKEGETFTTTSLLEINKEYKAPQDDKVILKFTKLPEKPGSISFTKTTLTPEQMVATKSSSEVAYDITSDMENGSFAYSLELPLPEQLKDSEHVGVKFAESPSTDDLKKASLINANDVELNQEEDTVTIKTLNHFTTFVIVDTTPITTNTQVVTPSSTNWTSIQENNATGTFTVGPTSTGSLGTGSYRIKLGALGANHSMLGAPNSFNNKNLSDLNTLAFSFYVANPGSPASNAEPHLAPELSLALDIDNNGSVDRTFTYQPCRADSATCAVNYKDNTWRIVDAFTGAGWSYNGAVMPGVNQTGQTLAYYIGQFPDAVVRDPNLGYNWSGIQFKVGEGPMGAPWNENYEVYLDNVTIGFENTSDTFDFEPGPLTAPLFWIEEQTSNVELAWNTVPSATGYNIYRSTNSAGPFTLVNGSPVVGTQYSDATATTGTSYYYKVTGVSPLLETDISTITAKHAQGFDFVIDDNSWQPDLGVTGTTTTGGVGGWDRYAVNPAGGVDGNSPLVLQNAVGGDDYSTGASATGQIYNWTTSASLNGTYEVFAQYVCDPSRGTARYRVYSGATQVGSDVLKNQNLTASGAACPGQSSANTESQWVSLGSFAFTGQARVELVADPGQVYIIADAVAFQGVQPVGSDLTVCKQDASHASLNGWDMVLGQNTQTHVFTDAELQSNVGFSTANLPAGNYVVDVSGYYDYGDAAMISDAGYSFRPDYIPCNNTPGQPNPWVSSATPCVNDLLGVRVNGNAQDWGSFTPANSYQKVVAHPGGPLKVSIVDDNYVDNSNVTASPLTVRISEATFTGTTANNGCFTFTGVQDGDYSLSEVMQSGWQRVDGDANDTVPANGAITVNGPATYTFVNTVAAIPSPSPTVSPSPTPAPVYNDLKICKEDLAGNRLSGWTMYVADDGDPSHTFTDAELQSDQGYSFSNMPAGDYVVEVNGYFDYGDTAMIGDAGYSFRPDYIPCNNTPGQPNPWVSNGIPCVNGLLNTQVNGVTPNWGPYAADHFYQSTIHHNGGDLKISIIDDNYVDNSNATDNPLRVSFFYVLRSGVTSDQENGCVTFPAVQPGGYILTEEMQSGWFRREDAPNDNLPTHGLIGMGLADQQYTFVNAGSPPPTATPTPTPSVSPSTSPSPSVSPSVSPTLSPSPTASPTVTPTPTPTVTPTPSVTPSPTPSVSPTASPSSSPAVSPSPTVSPSVDPSATPSATPTATPSVSPSASPSATPSVAPTPTPTATPSVQGVSTDNGGGGGGGSVTNNAQPPVCSATAPSSAPSVTITNTGANTVTLSWTAVNPVTHYALYFRRTSDGAEYGASNIGNTTTYTITNLSGQDSYTFEIFGVNDCAPGPRGQAGSGQVGGAILTGRPTGAGGQVLGTTTASPSPTASASATPDPSASPSVLGATDDGTCNEFKWWWVPMVIYAAAVIIMAFTLNNNHTPRRAVTLVGFVVTALFLYYWKCQPWPWIIGTGIGGAVVELFTSFLLSDDEEDRPAKTQNQS